MLKHAILIYLQLTLCVCGVAIAQPKLRLVRSPVPFWTSDAEAANKPGVYFDSKVNQIVIKSPEGQALDILQETRYDVANGASPEVLFSVAQTVPERFTYSYSLVDDTRAPQATRRFSLLLPAADATLTIMNKTPWLASTVATVFPDRTSVIALGTMRFVAWTHPGSPARSTNHVLQLESSYLPGFVDAFVEGAVQKPLTHEVLASLPTDLAEEAARFLEPGVGSSGFLVLGPLFRADVPKSVVAANFHYGLELLMRSGVLDSGSKYGKAALAVLDAFLQNGAADRPRAIQERPVTSLEQQLDSAMLLAFR